MKKNLLLAIALLLFKWGFSQGTTPSATTTQAASTPTVTLFGSYVALSDILVHPYKENTQDPSKTSNEKIDYSIHFHIKKGDKFVISKIINPNNTVTGYVITAWNYPDDKAGTKTASYKKLLDAQANTSQSESTKADLANKKKLIDASATDSAAVAKKSDTLKTNMAAVQAMLSDAQKQLLKVGLNTDPKKTSPPTAIVQGKAPVVKPEVTKFMTAQASLKASPESAQLKTDFLNVITNLSAIPDPLLAESKAEYSALGKKYNSLKADFDQTTSDLSAKTNNLIILRSAYQAEASALTRPQNSNPPSDPNSYKLTKEQHGETADANIDTTDPCAAYDDLEYLDSWANGWTFFINATDLANANTIFTRSDSFTWGFLTLPIKVRFDNSLPNGNGVPPGGRFNFEQNLNFGLTFGWKRQVARTSDVSWNLLGGVSVATVPLQNATPGSATVPAGTPATSTAALSLSIGEMFQYDKFQIGLFTGFDLAGTNANQFAYQSRRWIGIAIGLNLFGAGQTKAAATPNQN